MQLTIHVPDDRIESLTDREPAKAPEELVHRAVRYYAATDNAPDVLDEPGVGE